MKEETSFQHKICASEHRKSLQNSEELPLVGRRV
jgi:hypothetical protein